MLPFKFTRHWTNRSCLLFLRASEQKIQFQKPHGTCWFIPIEITRQLNLFPEFPAECNKYSQISTWNRIFTILSRLTRGIGNVKCCFAFYPISSEYCIDNSTSSSVTTLAIKCNIVTKCRTLKYIKIVTYCIFSAQTFPESTPSWTPV